MLSALLTTFDIFHQKVQLNVNAKNKLSTNAGNVLTAIVITVTILQSFMTINGIFNRTNPIINKQQEIQQDPGYLPLNSSNFVFALTVQDTGFNLSSSYVSFQMQYRVYTRLPNGTVVKNNTKVPLKKCDLDYMNQFSADFVKIGINNALCPTITQYDLTGTYLSDSFQFIKLTATSCMNDTSQPDIVCKPHDDVMKALTNATVQVQVFFSNTIFTPDNFTVPITQYMSNLYWNTIPGQETLNSDIFVNEQTLITDDNLWFSDWNPSIITSYQIDPTEVRPQNAALETLGSENYVLTNIYFRRSSNKFTTNRIFPKLQQGLVAIGGMFSVCSGIFGTIAFLYTRRVLAITIANEMYEFDIDPSEEKKKRRRGWLGCRWRNRKAETKKLPIGLHESILRRENTRKTTRVDNNGLNFYLNKFSKYSKNSKRKLKYNFMDFLLGVFCCGRRHKDRLADKAAKMVAKDIDIVQILKKLQELDKLKKVLLDENQNNVFSYSRPPLVSLEGSTSQSCLQSCLRACKKAPKKSTGIAITNLNRLRNLRSRDSLGRRGGSIMIRSPQLLESRQEYDGLYKFVSLFQSYLELIKQGTQNPLNAKILKLLDYEMDETLFNMTMETRSRQETKDKFQQLFGIKVFVEMLEKKRSKTRTQPNKLQAALLIARKIRTYINKKKTQQKSQEEGIASPNTIKLVPKDSLIDCEPKSNAVIPVEKTAAPNNWTGMSQLIALGEERKNSGMIISMDRQKTTISEITSCNKSTPRGRTSLGLSPIYESEISGALLNESQDALLKIDSGKQVKNKRRPKRLDPIKMSRIKRKPGEQADDSRNQSKAMLFDEFAMKGDTPSLSAFDHIL